MFWQMGEGLPAIILERTKLGVCVLDIACAVQVATGITGQVRLKPLSKVILSKFRVAPQRY